MNNTPRPFIMNAVSTDSNISPPWPGGSKGRFRVILVHCGRTAPLPASITNDIDAVYYYSEIGEPAARRMAEGLPRAENVERGQATNRLVEFFVGRSAVFVVSPKEAREAAANLLQIDRDVPADFDNEHICIIDVDANGAAVKKWNVSDREI